MMVDPIYIVTSGLATCPVGGNAKDYLGLFISILTRLICCELSCIMSNLQVYLLSIFGSRVPLENSGVFSG